MSLWDRLVELISASPFTGTYMSLATALVAFAFLIGIRRLLPVDDRHHGKGLMVLLVLGMLVGLFRLAIVAAGAGQTVAGRMMGFVTTFCVATGVVGAVILAAVEVLPARAGIRIPPILRDFIRSAAFVLIAFGVLTQSGLNVASLITTAGVLTAVVGLALQNTLANLFAGLMLNMDRELGLQDWVQVGGRVGQIVQIRWRSTLLRTPDGDYVIVPNSQMLGNEVYNFSRPIPRHRVWLRIGMHYRHPPNRVRQVLAEAAREAPGVLREPAPDCFPVEFGERAVVYALRFWIQDLGRQKDIEGEVITRVWYAAHRADLEIPLPIRTVHMIAETEEKRQFQVENERADRLAAVEQVDLFATLERTEREVLANGMRRVSYAKGETILHLGEPGDSLYLVSAGEVAVVLQKGQLEQEVAILGPGTFIGEMSLLTGQPRAATCVARTDVTAFVIDQATVRKVLTLRPQIAEEMSAILAARQADLQKASGDSGQHLAHSPENRKHLLSLIRNFFDLR